MGFFNKYPYTDFHELNLDWIINHFKEFIAEIDSLNDWKEQHEAEYQQLKDMYDAIVSGNFPPAMNAALHNWVVLNSASIFGELAKMVIFNITDDGYFVAYIPESWNDIIFGTTGLDEIIPGYDYGRLVLSYNA